MTPRHFLELAVTLGSQTQEASWRSAVSRAYYAAFHATSAFFRQMRFQVPLDASAHRYLCYRLQNAGQSLWERAGQRLEHLRLERTFADYDLKRPYTQQTANTHLVLAEEYFKIIDQMQGDDSLLRAVLTIREYERDVLGTVTYVGP
jgi:uncharacterized protein (UPF0332 family)